MLYFRVDGQINLQKVESEMFFFYLNPSESLKQLLISALCDWLDISCSAGTSQVSLLCWSRTHFKPDSSFFLLIVI